MKNLVLIAIVGLCYGGVATATEIDPIKPAPEKIESFKITEMNINPNSPELGGRTFIGGKIEVDFATNEIVATFFPKQIVCQPGQLCPALMFGPTVIRLPITYTAAGLCGTHVVTGEKDAIYTELMVTKLQVDDDRENTCEEKLGMQLTLTEETAQHQTFVSTFEGI